MSKQHTNEGTFGSYAIGFVLALVCTLIPYYLVVHQTVTGNGLLATILGFAVVQLFIQIIFFLHIGRGPKPKWELYFFAATFAIIMVVVGGSILIINNLHYNMTPDQQTANLVNNEGITQVSGVKTGACPEAHTNHVVEIKNNQFSPKHLNASKCDTLTLRNEDSVNRMMDFGVPPQNIPYAGQRELSLPKNYNQTIILSKTGTYQFYDSLHPTVTGSFSVN
jgi:cytochrome o ubiquinol oxidase operon protein cyoD